MNQTPTTGPELTPERRLEIVNAHFRRKAAEVMNGQPALMLLAGLYETVVVNLADFDVAKNGIALARLAAANFAEIGAEVIYITITHDGQRFIQAIENWDPPRIRPTQPGINPIGSRPSP